MQYTRLEVLEMCFNREKQVFAVPTGTPKDIVESPQMAARGFMIEVDHPELERTIRYPGPPYRLPESPWEISRRAPLIGEHNDDVYRGLLNLTDDEIESLKQDGVV